MSSPSSLSPSLSSLPSDRPAVVAHRGSSIVAPEHTRAAYEAAIAEGADGFECDVRLTGDDVPVCFHDPRLDRITERPGVVADMTLEELGAFDYAAAWRRRQEPREQRDAGPAGLLSFDEFLGIAGGAGRPIALRVEVKRPSRGGDLLERRTVEVLREHELLPRGEGDWQVAAMSFSPTSLGYLHRIAPTLPLIRLYDRVPTDAELGALPRWIRGVGPGIRAVREDPSLPERIRFTGRIVNVWTVDSADDVDLLLERGVDGIITNRPGFVRGCLSERLAG